MVVEQLTEYHFDKVYERDMDFLFIQMASYYQDFLEMLLKKTGRDSTGVRLVAAEHSKVMGSLGESDIELIVEQNGIRIGLLIEDKVDAGAMQNQCARYFERGSHSVDQGEYSDFCVFIFCPRRYLEGNEEAKKYQYSITYEECESFLETKNDAMSYLFRQQISVAIGNAKKPAKHDEIKQGFLRNYKKFQEDNYSVLDMATQEGKLGDWIQYRTQLRGVYILHKLQEGQVCLIIPNSASEMKEVKEIAEQLNYLGLRNIFAEKASKSAALRINVPVLHNTGGWDMVVEAELRDCFDSIMTLYRLSDAVSNFTRLINS
ncbi:hypothetical protein [Anaerotardibacter muris]|uniref:hypothetical protein n=1 Tax=Anaerotardibacter muris TaxID=2941505 RepID=UPI0020410C53|nr:hypothetical protein [Anaerotardibacter muris]